MQNYAHLINSLMVPKRPITLSTGIIMENNNGEHLYSAFPTKRKAL